MPLCGAASSVTGRLFRRHRNRRAREVRGCDCAGHRQRAVPPCRRFAREDYQLPTTTREPKETSSSRSLTTEQPLGMPGSWAWYSLARDQRGAFSNSTQRQRPDAPYRSRAPRLAARRAARSTGPHGRQAGLRPRRVRRLHRARRRRAHARLPAAGDAGALEGDDDDRGAGGTARVCAAARRVRRGGRRAVRLLRAGVRRRGLRGAAARQDGVGDGAALGAGRATSAAATPTTASPRP